ncbi:MAG: glycosyltransferase family 39 protein, partial [Dehalococcoidia bacterium]|nr:glycosyltransferase family 39 protein [Dehalococcoidia bacterium]
WPLLSQLDERLTTIYATPQSAALSIVLFVVAMVLFVLSLRVLLPDKEEAASNSREAAPPRRAFSLSEPGWPQALFITGTAATIGGWAFLLWRLIVDRYDPVLWWLFVGVASSACVLLLFIDRTRGARITRSLRWHLWEIAFVAGITGLFIGLMAQDLTDWRYAGIEDQGPFWYGARGLAEGNEEINLFSQNGVFGYIPVLSSAYQATVMRFAGVDVFGWKLASTLALAASLPVFYWLVRTLFGVRPAVYATAILGVSHLLFAYAHTGYPNIFPLFPTVLAFALFFAGLRGGSTLLMFGSGIAAGFGFYTFYSGRATIGILALAVLMAGLRQVRLSDLRSGQLEEARRWAGSVLLPVSAGFVMTVAPIFASDGWKVISDMRPQSVFREGVNATALTTVVHNIPRAFLGFNFQPTAKHYVSGSLLDELSAVLAMIGLGYAVYRVRHEGHGFLVTWFVIAAIVSGVFHLRAEQDLMTRFHYVLPAAAALAGLALDRAIAGMASFAGGRRLDRALGVACFAIVLPVVLGFNAHRFWVETPKVLVTPHTAVVLREAGSPACDREGYRSAVFARPLSFGAVQDVFNYYRWDDRMPEVLQYDALPDGYQAMLTNGTFSCIMLTEPERPDVQPVLVQMERLAEQSGTVLRDEADTSGQTHILVLELGTSGAGPSQAER